jgi:outer membrane protein assembly factor BamB
MCCRLYACRSVIPSVTLWLVMAFLPGMGFADDWPTWRGPLGDGVSTEAATLTDWGPQKNLRWKVALPSGSNSSPIVRGGRVFVTAASDGGKIRSLLAFDRRDGSKLWQQSVEFDGRESKHSTNPYCSASPVTDGEVACASFGSAGLIGCTLDGRLLWRKDLGKLEHVFGNATSPVLHGNLCILWCGPGSRQFLLAVEKRTGKQVWRYEVPGGKPDFNAPSACVGSWATPIIATVSGREQLILNAPDELMSLDPRTGKRLWYARGIGKLAYASPVIWEDTVVAMSGYHGPVLAVRATGDGDVTKTHRLWQLDKRQPQRIGSPLASDGRLYCVNENGTAACFDLRTGEQLLSSKERVCGQTWSSLVQAGGKLYVSSLSGETAVLNRDLSVVARNRLSDRIASSPAVSDGQIFIRGYDHLYCIGHED